MTQPVKDVRPYSRMDSSMLSLFQKSEEICALKKSTLTELDDTSDYDRLIESVKSYKVCYSKTKPEVQADYIIDILHFNKDQIVRGPGFDSWLVEGEDCTFEHETPSKVYELDLSSIYKLILEMTMSSDRNIADRANLIKLSFLRAIYAAMSDALKNEKEKKEDTEETIQALEKGEEEILSWIPRGAPKREPLGKRVGSMLEPLLNNMPQILTSVRDGMKEMGMEDKNPEAMKMTDEFISKLGESTGEGGILNHLAKDLQKDNVDYKSAFENIKSMIGPLVSSMGEQGEPEPPTEGESVPQICADSDEVLCIEN